MFINDSQVSIFTRISAMTTKSTVILCLSHVYHQHRLCLLCKRKTGSHRIRTNGALLELTVPVLLSGRNDLPPSDPSTRDRILPLCMTLFLPSVTVVLSCLSSYPGSFILVFLNMLKIFLVKMRKKKTLLFNFSI